ncbi:MAG: MaoC family dehydratase [Cypionkella sp.]
MARELMPGRWSFDEIHPGDHLTTDWAEVSPESIDHFAALTGDRFEIHLTDAGAARHGFAARVAHGLLVLSLVEGLKSQSPVQFDSFASLGWEWSFRQPVYAGDRIRARIAVKAKRPASADKGLLTLSVTVETQTAQVVQRGETRLMTYRSRQSPNPKAM